MDIGSLSEVCRVCANKIKDKKRQRHIFNYLRGKLLQNLKLITGVKLLPNESLPNFICERCNSELELAIKFRERCIFSQNYLEDLLKKQYEELSAKNELSEELIDEAELEYQEEPVAFEDDKVWEEENYTEMSDDDNVKHISEEAEEIQEVFEIAELEQEEQEQPKNNKRHMVLLQENRPTKRLRNFFICEECGGFFNKEKDYNNHMKGHTEHKESPQFFPCCQCTAHFSTKTMLKQHRRDVHNGNRLFKCGICGEGFLEHTAKQRHEIAHSNERPYPCLECEETFTSVAELRLHSATHSLHTTKAIKDEGETFPCVQCEENFDSDAELQEHFEIHCQRFFRCEPCNEEFASYNELNKHSSTYAHQCTVRDEMEMLYAEDECEEEQYLE
ncbi:zinc finger protein 132 [Drosophila sulfurigaster albostrigata]|uniref:zinc finger protein 132 n=1 Tax=Drosophila sulfurigaster albostrigata TaxID=89887 RepID=UPI002D21C1F5|nr:zinc finger protein 132 [Drosophila sulfurigaster albostrigata]